MTSEWMKIDEACEYLNVSRYTILRLVSQGKIPATDVGTGKYRQLRFSKTQLDERLREQQPKRPWRGRKPIRTVKLREK